GQTAQNDLESFAQTSRLDFDLQSVRFPHLVQHVILEQQQDFEQLVQAQERKLRDEKDRGKMMTADQQILAATLKANGALQVRVYGRCAQIVNGQLQLIRPITELHYTPQLELEKQVTQILEGPMVTAARFQIVGEGCQGVMVRGHMLQ